MDYVHHYSFIGYRFYSDGSVYREPREGERNYKGGYLTTQIQRNQKDYPSRVVRLYSNHKQKAYSLPRLMLEAWQVLPKTKNHSHIGFRDGDPTNCNLSNLFWGIKKAIIVE